MQFNSESRYPIRFRSVNNHGWHKYVSANREITPLSRYTKRDKIMRDNNSLSDLSTVNWPTVLLSDYSKSQFYIVQTTQINLQEKADKFTCGPYVFLPPHSILL